MDVAIQEFGFGNGRKWHGQPPPTIHGNGIGLGAHAQPTQPRTTHGISFGLGAYAQIFCFA